MAEIVFTDKICRTFWKIDKDWPTGDLRGLPVPRLVSALKATYYNNMAKIETMKPIQHVCYVVRYMSKRETLVISE